MILGVALCLAASLLQAPPKAVATFDGVLKSLDKKFIVVQVEGGETMRMYATRATKYVRGGSDVRAMEFHEGESVTVDAERDARFNLVAVKLELAKASAPK